MLPLQRCYLLSRLECTSIAGYFMSTWSLMIRIICYGFTVYYLSTSIYPAYQWYRRPEAHFLENVFINCDPIYSGLPGADRYRFWELQTEHVEQELQTTGDFCQTVNKYFFFEKSPLSEEEKNFPLAYGFIVYKDIIQILLQISTFYQPQNQFCFTIDEFATDEFKKMIMTLPKCFDNMATFIGENSGWASFGIVENMYNCIDYLVALDRDWKYYQYMSGSDVPMRTNLEMVRIMKALNGSFNSDVEMIEINRLNHLRAVDPPLHLYKSSMSVALPRAGANYMVHSKKIKELLTYLQMTQVPDETFWTTLGGNKNQFPMPGSFEAKDILRIRHHTKFREGNDTHTTDHIGSSFIGRYQIWWTQTGCKGAWRSASCVFGVHDVPTILQRPELVAHKMYLLYQPAAMMCLIKEIRRRSYHPIEFDTHSYAEMPTVELHNGKLVEEITHPDWVKRSSFA